MQNAPLLPETAPFAAEQISALNGVMSASTAEQRHWLSGFLAGFQAATQKLPAAANAPTPRAPLTILFATESGNSEALANAARKQAAALGFKPRLLDAADATPEALAGAENLLAIVSTWGEGDPPQRAIDFFRAIEAADAARLDGVRFAVLALGDRAYANFCAVGAALDARLAALGATRVADRIDCDVDYEAPANAWLGTTLETLRPATEPGAVIHVDFARGEQAQPAESPWTRANPFAAEVTGLVNLNGSRSTGRTFHVELSLEGAGIAYEPGDALGFTPQNDPAEVDALLDAAGLAGDAAAHATLLEGYDIATLSRPQVEAYAALTGDAAIAAFAGDAAQVGAFLPGRHVIDLLHAMPNRLSTDQLTRLLRRQTPRLYSVASSRRAVGEEAHLLIAAVDYETHGRRRRGVASGDVADRRHVGGHMGVYLKPNPHFRLPTDSSTPIVMIGPGTGVAPFRGFVQEREATGASGRSWLFFGHRSFQQDFFYQLEWQEKLKDGALTRMDVAFSRDQPEKIYVQDRLWQRRAELYAWIEDGAVLYVCGDANAMARNVHATLVRILADQGGLDAEAAEARLDALRREKRYLRDVY